MKPEPQKKVLLSGAKPSGELHIGNYIGAIKQWIQLQDTHETYVPIVDLHALTEPQDPVKLREQILTTAADYVALGLDPEKAAIFLQSAVPEHTQLMWILNTLTSMGDLERMVVYKEKIAEGKQALAGLFTYPVLMAADILLYKPSVVPVGEDQRQHVELTRAITRKFNKRFGQTFPIPKELHPPAGKKILSLQDPTKKMSKPAISNLMTIYAAFSGKKFKEIEKEFSDASYKDFKETLAGLVVEKLKPVQEKRKELLENKMKLTDILEEGAAKARAKASETLKEVYEKVGLTI